MIDLFVANVNKFNFEIHCKLNVNSLIITISSNIVVIDSIDIQLFEKKKKSITSSKFNLILMNLILINKIIIHYIFE